MGNLVSDIIMKSNEIPLLVGWFIFSLNEKKQRNNLNECASDIAEQLLKTEVLGALLWKK